ncbi:septum formation protein [Melghirimyces profundicolus]|uniref:dTTP/UTP pyrophosphatase n=1 Tax=Melghirimyces profundicolus TaxID=1242148 RepID=A0A2T6BTI0_9BACL|nr:Maf family protein [Melghirimyces profundicolus]PTX59390.1 septum formation protein [Melghirimyces profundicolus]
MQPELVLASGSPRRKQMLQNLGLSFSVHPSSVTEDVPGDPSPGEWVEILAAKKALAVAHTKKQALVIGSDTVVALGDEIIGKPGDEREAIRILERLQGNAHQVCTGIALVEVKEGKVNRRLIDHRVTEVMIRNMNREEIEWYVSTGEPMDKAGAYGLQGIGSLWVDWIDGCYTNVVGMSLPLLYDMMNEMGYPVLKPSFAPENKG